MRKGKKDPWHEATRTDTREQPAWVPGMSEAPIPLGGPAMEIIDTRSDAEKIKERQLAYMTAAVMWFLLVCAFLIVGSFVLRLCAEIL